MAVHLAAAERRRAIAAGGRCYHLRRRQCLQHASLVRLSARSKSSVSPWAACHTRLWLAATKAVAASVACTRLPPPPAQSCVRATCALDTG